MTEHMITESFGIIPLQQEEAIWKILLIQHLGAGHWGFPKGRRNEKETPIEAAKRELKEETGLEVTTLLQEQAITETYTFVRKGQKIEKIVSYFPALVSGTLKLQQEEITDARWYDLEAASKKLTFKEGRATLAHVLQQLDLS